MEDKARNNDFFIEVNFDTKPENQKCRVLKITFPGGTHAYIERRHLHSMLFAISEPEQQLALVPQTMIRKKRFEGLVRMKATKDIKKGEDIVTVCRHDLPVSIDEFLENPAKTPAGLVTAK